MGVSWVGWSSSGSGGGGTLLAAREEAHPRCLWVWRPLQAQLVAVLVLLDAITCAQWRPAVVAAAAASSAAGAVMDGSGVNLPTANNGGINAHSSRPPLPPLNTHHAAASVDEHQHPAQETEVLAFCTGTARVYFWTALTGVTYADLGTICDNSGNNLNGMSFAVMSLRWGADGRTLLLRGKESHCVCQVNLPVGNTR